jgi:hypothetical protein
MPKVERASPAGCGGAANQLPPDGATEPSAHPPRPHAPRSGGAAMERPRRPAPVDRRGRGGRSTSAHRLAQHAVSPMRQLSAPSRDRCRRACSPLAPGPPEGFGRADEGAHGCDNPGKCRHTHPCTVRAARQRRRCGAWPADTSRRTCGGCARRNVALRLLTGARADRVH